MKGEPRELKLTVNGEPHELMVKPKTLLVELLRNELRLIGTKQGCLSSSCGVCTVIIDGRAVRSCSILALQADGHEVTTVEGVADGDKLHPIQEAFVEHGAIECGFCTPARVMAAKALLDENPHPTEDEIKEALAGHICRCGAFYSFVESMAMASEER